MAESRWSDLPGDLLTAIAKLLNTKIDTLRLRAVCSSWRSSVPAFDPKPSCPLILPYPISPCPPYYFGKIPIGYFTLSQNAVYFLLPPSTSNSHSPWLCRAEELDNGKLRPLNPLSRMLTGDVPDPNFPKVLNFLDLPAFEICRAFSMDFVEISKNIDETTCFKFKQFLIRKVVVSSHPFTPDGDDYEIVALYGPKLGFIRVGDERWSLIEGVGYYDDVVYHKGQFYVVDLEGKTVVIGPDLKATEVAAPSRYLRGDCKTLLTFGEDLYLIDKYIGIATEIDSDVPVVFKVYKLDKMKKKWVVVDTLGDKVVFAALDCSYAVSAQDFVGLERNCIYFSEYPFECDNEDLGDLFVHTGVYSLDDGKCRPLASVKNHSQIFWPPPAWLQPNRRPQ